jgi:hypothetical protein
MDSLNLDRADDIVGKHERRSKDLTHQAQVIPQVDTAPWRRYLDNKYKVSQKHLATEPGRH